MISPTGEGLNILIDCKYIPQHDWMVFASWYSISKNLPDAIVKIICQRSESKSTIFRWPNRCLIPLKQYLKSEKLIKDQAIDLGLYQNEEEILIITPDIMCVSFYDVEHKGPIDVKSDENFTFVSYLHGCGKFVLQDWLNIKNPFFRVDRFYSENMFLNERRVLKLWDKGFKTYLATA